MTGTNSSNDRLILRRNVEINSNWYFSYDVFSGMKSSTTWNGNAIAQSPRKMSEFRDISNTSDIRFLMVYRTIIDVILHLFIICNDLWCQLPFFTPQPSGLEGYCRHGPGGRAGGRTGGRAGGRAGGRLPDLWNPYLCNRWMDFLRSKFYGIV